MVIFVYFIGNIYLVEKRIKIKINKINKVYFLILKFMSWFFFIL